MIEARQTHVRVWVFNHTLGLHLVGICKVGKLSLSMSIVALLAVRAVELALTMLNPGLVVLAELCLVVSPDAASTVELRSFASVAICAIGNSHRISNHDVPWLRKGMVGRVHHAGIHCWNKEARV